MAMCMLSRVRLLATPWTEPTRLLCPWDFPRQEHWNGLPSPPPGDLPDPGTEPVTPASPALTGRFFTAEPPGSPQLGLSKAAQSCPTLCDPTDCSPPGSSVRGIFQARVLEWVAISFSRGSSQSRDQTQVSSIADGCFTV